MEPKTSGSRTKVGLQVIFGTGPVGCAAARHLLEQGLSVRMVNRSGRRPVGLLEDLAPDAQARLEFRAADVMDAVEARAVCAAATHIYHCMNVSYELWRRDLPVMHASLLGAAVAHGAVLAVAENLYMYDRAAAVISEDAPIDPPSRKGKLVRALHENLARAGRENGLAWVSVRASDFYGPGALLQSVFGTVRFLDPLFAGKRLGMIGNLDLPHTYTYVGDYGRALAIAALRPDAHGAAWIVPNDRTLTTREVAQMFFSAADRAPGLARIPRAAIAAAGLFSPLLRELLEVLHQKEQPYRVDGSRFSARFGLEPTRLEDGVRMTLEWYASTRSGSAPHGALRGAAIRPSAG
jgi:nucleoside-diphosphate-sugar epimerase